MDDAVLSCGGLLHELLPHMDCLTVTVCTGDPENSDVDNPPHGIALPKVRRHEEVAAMAALGCPLIELDLLDAIYRTDPETNQLLYPTMESIWSMPLPNDRAQKQALRSRLLSLRGESRNRPTLFVAPLGIGHHIDHILCTQVVLSVVETTDHVLLYEDFPYVVDQGENVGVADDARRALGRHGLLGLQCFENECDTELKMGWISYYESQIDLIFGSQDNVRPFLLKRSKNANTFERFWKVQKDRNSR